MPLPIAYKMTPPFLPLLASFLACFHPLLPSSLAKLGPRVYLDSLWKFICAYVHFSSLPANGTKGSNSIFVRIFGFLFASWLVTIIFASSLIPQQWIRVCRDWYSYDRMGHMTRSVEENRTHHIENLFVLTAKRRMANNWLASYIQMC